MFVCFLGQISLIYFFNIKTFISQCVCVFRSNFSFISVYFLFFFFYCSWCFFVVVFSFFLSVISFRMKKMACLSLCHISIICSVSKFLSHFHDLYQYKNIHIFVCYSEFEYSLLFCYISVIDFCIKIFTFLSFLCCNSMIYFCIKIFTFFSFISVSKYSRFCLCVCVYVCHISVIILFLCKTFKTFLSLIYVAE